MDQVFIGNAMIRNKGSNSFWRTFFIDNFSRDIYQRFIVYNEYSYRYQFV